MLQKGKERAVESPARLEQALKPEATKTVTVAFAKEGPKKKVSPMVRFCEASPPPSKY